MKQGDIVKCRHRLCLVTGAIIEKGEAMRIARVFETTSGSACAAYNSRIFVPQLRMSDVEVVTHAEQRDPEGSD